MLRTRKQSEPTTRRRRAFTLLEGLISVAVMAVAVPTILTPFAAGMENDAEDARQAIATTLAAEMMDEVLSKPFSDPEGESELGPEDDESSRQAFDNMDDYDGFKEPVGTIADAFGTIMTEPQAMALSRKVEVDYVYVNGQLMSEDPSFARVTVSVLKDEVAIMSLVSIRYDLGTTPAPGAPSAPTIPMDFVLLSSGGTALSMSGNGTVTLRGKKYINSSSSSAARLTGNAKLIAQAVDIVGDYSTSGNAKIEADVTTGVSDIPADPYGDVPEPSQSDYTTQSSSKLSVGGNDTATLQPGIYKGGLSFDGNARVTMEPGVYYLDSGGFDIKGNAQVQAEGVMIYLDSGKKVNMSGNGTINWTPPDSGDYEGISIFYGRSVSETLSITGNGGMQITGSVYGVNIDVKLAGNGSMDVLGGAYVVNKIEIKGNGGLSLGHPDARQ